MTDRTLLARRFETERPWLRAIATRLPGSAADADDAVQETCSAWNAWMPPASTTSRRG